MMTGSTSGRRPDRLRKNRRSSTRILSLMSPGSVRSSTLDPFDDVAARMPASLSATPRCRSTTKPRVIMSGALRERPTACQSPPPARPGRHLRVTPIAQHLVADLAAAGAVDQHASGGHFSGDATARLVETHDVAALGEHDLRRSAAITRVATRACRASWRYSPCIGTK